MLLFKAMSAIYMFRISKQNLLDRDAEINKINCSAIYLLMNRWCLYHSLAHVQSHNSLSPLIWQLFKMFYCLHSATFLYRADVSVPPRLNCIFFLINIIHLEWSIYRLSIWWVSSGSRCSHWFTLGPFFSSPNFGDSWNEYILHFLNICIH